MVQRARLLLPFLALTGALALLPAAPAGAAVVTRTGEVLAVHGHSRTGKAVARGLALRSGARVLSLSFRRGVRAPAPGSRVRLRGSLRGGRLAVRAVRVLPAAPPRARAAHLLDGAKRVAVVLFDFAGGPSRTASRTPASVQASVFGATGSLGAYLEEVSGGRVTISGDVFGYYTIAPPAGSRPSEGACDWSTWIDEADAAAQAAGVDLSGYDRILYLHARVSACDYAGLAPVSSRPLGKGTFIELNDDDSTRVTTHEWGHTYGLQHSASYRCTSGGAAVAISGSCTASEYGDPFDTMGSGGGRWYQAFERVELGLLPALTGTQTVQASGRYTIGALASSATASRLLRIPRPDGTVYGLEYRRPFGTTFEAWASTAPVVNGVTIRILPGNYLCCSSPLARLIDTTPSTSTFTDAPLGVGRTFTDALDPADVITVRTDAAGPDAATVTVDLGGPAPAAQPAAAPAEVAPAPPATVAPPPDVVPPDVVPPADASTTTPPPAGTNTPPSTARPAAGKKAAKKKAKKKAKANAKARATSRSRARRASRLRAAARHGRRSHPSRRR